MRLKYLIIAGLFLELCYAGDETIESDGDTSRKILGSSVVTSVSVVMDTGNKKNAIYTDAVGKPQSKPSNPSELASPIDLLNPDRYEFYTFDDNGDLVKRLMSLDEIKSIIATGDSEALDLDSFTAQGFLPEKRVSDVVNNVQSVLKEEMEILKDPISKPIFDTPDVSDSWSMILPAVFGNSGEDIKPEKPAGYVTPDTIMLEPNSQLSHTTLGPQKVDIILSSIATTRKPAVTTYRPSSSSTPRSTHISHPVYYSSPTHLTTKTMSSTTQSLLNVEIFSNSISTTDTQYSKEPETQTSPKEEVELIPTRASLIYSTRPPLVRNNTRTTTFRPNVSTSSTNIKPQTDGVLNSSVKPSTQKATQTSQENPISSTSFKPTTSQWASTSFKPTSTQVSSSTHKAPIKTSTTAKPIPNIFGLSSDISTRLTSIQTSRPSSIKPTVVPNIFGLPANINQKNKPSIVTTSSTSVKTTSAIGTTTSQISIKPQLSTSSTVSNVQSSKRPVTEITKTTEQTIEKVVSSSTQKSPSSNPLIWTPSPEDAQLFNVFKEVINQTPSTEVNQKLSSITTTEYLPIDTTSINDALHFESTKIQTNYPSTDLNTLSTEYIRQKVPTTTIYEVEDATTKLPPLLNSLNEKQKLSASELLDQLLITTNIYEINTELASSKLNITDTDDRFDNSPINSTSSSQDSELQMTTTDHDIISYPPTTDITLIQSIEQLLSQAVGDVHTILNQTTESILYNSGSLSKEGETEFIDVTTSSTDEKIISTTVDNIEPEASTDNANLTSSIEALLSQINDHTTLNGLVFTEKPNIGVTYRRVDDNAAGDSTKVTTSKPTFSSTMATITSQQNTTISISQSKPDNEPTTIYYVINKKPTKVSTTTEKTSQLINITLLNMDANQNRTKPAKADLSLEQQLIAEELKNLTLIQNKTEINELLKESESKTVHLDTTASPKVEDKTQQIEQDITTTQVTTDIGTTIVLQGETTEPYLVSTTNTETTTNDLRFANEDDLTTIIALTESSSNSLPLQSSITQETTRIAPKPSIVITLNPDSTIVADNGKIVANKTISNTPGLEDPSITSVSPIKMEKNSTLDQTWTLVSTLAPQQASEQKVPPPTISYPEVMDKPVPVDLVPKPMQGFGLEESTSALDIDVHQFVQLCNELAFGFWKTITIGLSSARSIFVSPFAATSMLAMVFLGAKGATSEEMNEILKLDDMVTFNPHLTFKSVSESVTSEPNSGVATTAMIKELFSDRSKGKLLDFYKNRVRAFYDGFVEEVSYREIGDVIRRRSNLLVKKYTDGKYPQFFNDASIIARPPLSGVSINIFETDCSQTSSKGRDGELYFVVHPSIKQRRLVPIPAVVYKTGFLAGYEPSLDATAVAIGGKDQIVSTILVIPGQQGIAAPGDGLARLEKRLVESSFKKGAWSRLLRSLIPRPGLEVQIPRFSHRSVINTTNTLQRMGLHELFNPDSADLRGLNGVANELHLSDVLQINKFATCGEKREDDAHHSEVYPATTQRARAARRLLYNPTFDLEEPRDYQRAFHDPLHDPSLLELPLSLRPRQARIPEVPRLRLDRPFLYFVRHNPTGLILHMGRFNPRLLP